MALFTQTIRVRFAETDAMQIVHHGRYLEYLEAARIAFLDKVGMPYQKLVEQGYHLPVVEASLKYRQSAYFDDRLDIRITTAPLKGVRLTLHYEVCREDQILAEASTTHVFLKDNKAVRPLPAFAKALEDYLAQSV